VLLQTDADRRFLAAKGSVPIGIGKNSHIKRAIIDKNARIGDNVKVMVLFIMLEVSLSTRIIFLSPKLIFF
jgi:glucose-1-phosphate adenylyltransferase